MWPDGNATGSWVDPVPFVIGLVLIGALFVAAVTLLVVYVTAAVDGVGGSDE